ncbi:WASH complex subunit 5-like [Histomonas meleagridis]|uniref:WASH complex subunit 5-like n=1 Tax=Histomonas meleagridis TaxID=135588 RepID=UPI00355A9D85|nr:WASH complex subunit 5-like [Histomonas meleagridis]KAH0802328.1 WASH complex subunit 5-like [Histomonas meleagridis]
MELLSKSNPCGWSLLTIVSRGSSIIAEIQRLSQYIPEDFTFPKTNLTHPYAKILYDFDYIGRESEIESTIEHNQELKNLDEECRETHVEIVTRFSRLFESIVRYVLDFLHYLDQLSQNYFLQMSVESLLRETDGKQLLGEALYQYGVMLLQMDSYIPGIVRERILVAFSRWRGSSLLLNYSKVCEVCRSTGYVKGHPIPPAYPLELINRIEIPSNFVNLLIDRYRNDDVYLQMPNYPDAEHRSVALATQGAMLFIFLLFSPETLQSSTYLMKEITSRFFFDNWIVPYFMGSCFDLNVVWKPFPAAYSAVSEAMKTNANQYYQRMISLLPKYHSQIKQILSDGFTKLEQLLDNIDNYVKVVRDSNVILRFLVLQTVEPSKKAVFPLDRDTLLAFLLDLAEFEFELKTALDDALNKKPELWNDERTKAANLLRELALSFSGTLSLSSLQKDENLQKWFESIANEVEQLENENSQTNTQKIFQLIVALEKLLQFSQISQSIFIKESVAKVIGSLKTLGRLLCVDESYGPLIGTLSDFKYGFYIINSFIPLMQHRIKNDPFSVLKLRATFLKLTSLLDLQLIRIVQAESPDAVSVSEHYSTLIVDFVRTVLEIVPISIFDVLAQIIRIQTDVLKELPNRIERIKLKEYAQLNDRSKLAALTKEISILTSGVLAMKTTLMGVITVDPKQMLEEGIRKQLVKKIVNVLYYCIVNSDNKKKNNAITLQRFNQIIDLVGKALEGIQHSFEYMGDYVNLDGLRIWHHEYNRIMCFLVEQESNRFLRKKILSWQSEFQSKISPIELPKLKDNKKYNTCLGVLSDMLIELTNIKHGIYCEIIGGWLNPNTGEEVLGTKTINKMCNAIGIEGTSSIDTLLSFILADRLKNFFKLFENEHFGNFYTTMQSLLNLWPNPPQSLDVYNNILQNISHDLNNWTNLVCGIGQIQLLKATIDSHMKLKCQLEANSLHFLLQNANNTVLQAIKQFYRDPTHNPYPSSQLIIALSAYLENCGICEPLEKIYTLPSSVPEISFVLFAITLLNLGHPKIHEDDRLHMLIHNEHYGHYEFIVGIITILRQLNVQHQYAYLTFLGQYTNFLLASPKGGKKEDTNGIAVLRDLKYIMIFVKDYEALAKCPRRMIDSFISPTIFDFLSI